MSQKLIFCLTMIVLSCSCSPKRDDAIASGKSQVADTIEIGDDIYAAERKLVEAGLGITYGPDFPTESKSYLLMLVDYGSHPNGLETFKYTVGIEGSNKPIDGIIKATPEGKITGIE